jgi:hypothetical protein
MRDSDSRELWADQVQERGELGEDNGLTDDDIVNIEDDTPGRSVPVKTSAPSPSTPAPTEALCFRKLSQNSGTGLLGH